MQPNHPAPPTSSVPAPPGTRRRRRGPQPSPIFRQTQRLSPRPRRRAQSPSARRMPQCAAASRRRIAASRRLERDPSTAATSLRDESAPTRLRPIPQPGSLRSAERLRRKSYQPHQPQPPRPTPCEDVSLRPRPATPPPCSAQNAASHGQAVHWAATTPASSTRNPPALPPGLRRAFAPTSHPRRGTRRPIHLPPWAPPADRSAGPSPTPRQVSESHSPSLTGAQRPPRFAPGAHPMRSGAHRRSPRSLAAARSVGAINPARAVARPRPRPPPPPPPASRCPAACCPAGNYASGAPAGRPPLHPAFGGRQGAPGKPPPDAPCPTNQAPARPLPVPAAILLRCALRALPALPKPRPQTGPGHPHLYAASRHPSTSRSHARPAAARVRPPPNTTCGGGLPCSLPWAPACGGDPRLSAQPPPHPAAAECCAGGHHVSPASGLCLPPARGDSCRRPARLPPGATHTPGRAPRALRRSPPPTPPKGGAHRGPAGRYQEPQCA